MPLPADFGEFLRLLGTHGVEYQLVGGYAVAYHGYPRATQDLEIWIACRPDVAARMVEVLEAFGFDDSDLSTDLFLDPDQRVRLGNPPMRLEILTSVSGLDFEDSYERAIHTWIDGIPITVISLRDLRTNKQAAGRPRDLADLEELPDT
jgi:hypothetical protein